MAEQALANVRVLELTAAMAGPWIGRYMAACGAEVIRVESRKHPDVVRLYVPPRAPETGIQPRSSPWFTDWNAGKRFVALDLARPRAVELFLRLAARADIVVSNYSAGVMDRLGLGYEALRRANEQIIVFATSGYGESGPCSAYVTWGPNIEALSGLGTLSGFPGRECTITQYAYPDVLTALHGLFAVMCALDHRRRTGRGQCIDLAQLEATVAAIGDVVMERLANGVEPPRLGNRSRTLAPHGCYRCRGDDRWCVIAVRDEAEWARFCDAVGEPSWEADPRFSDRTRRLAHAEELDALIERWTAPRSDYEVMGLLQAAGIGSGVVQHVGDLAREDRQLAARRFFEEVEHLQRGRVVTTGVPLGLSGTPVRTGRSGGAVGEDNEHVFGTLLGMSADEIRACIEDGAIEAPEG
jgi:crotonobetainyl-CoA:carnitine CoA-transferase CaiB-like acyl-CoA transferase